MGMIEDAAVKAREALDIAGKKTEELIALQKLRFRLASLKSQLGRDYQLLGSLYYDQVKNKQPAGSLIDGQILKIDALLAEIREVEQSIAEQKGQVLCPACRTGQPSDAVFCNRCGAKLGTEPAPAETEEAPVQDAPSESPADADTAPDTEA